MSDGQLPAFTLNVDGGERIEWLAWRSDVDGLVITQAPSVVFLCGPNAPARTIYPDPDQWQVVHEESGLLIVDDLPSKECAEWVARAMRGLAPWAETAESFRAGMSDAQLVALREQRQRIADETVAEYERVQRRNGLRSVT